MITSYSGFKKFIFVSYAHKDKDIVTSILSRLQGSGTRFWYDEGLEHGVEWADRIAKKIEESICFLVFLSKNSLSDESFVKNEIHMASTLKKPILSIYIDDIQPRGGIQLLIGKFQSVKFDPKEKDGNFYSKLFEQLPSEAQENNELPRVGLYQYTLIAKGDNYSYFLKDFDYNDDIHYVNVYRIMKLEHETGKEDIMFEYCAGRPLITNAKCHCIYQTNIPKSPYQCFYSESELFFQLVIESDTSFPFSQSRANKNVGYNENLNYKNKGKFYANFSFKIENPFTANDKLVELKREGEAAEGFNSKCFEKVKI
ncbi:MAG: toll/interleukin-1 receptor domain-containing protein [Bacteroidales bacterium]|nr:toll/interleukin-1 receptor domain-containing protein [Bacteroidales bacterium]